jgi:hypothetical protein
MNNIKTQCALEKRITMILWLYSDFKFANQKILTYGISSNFFSAKSNQRNAYYLHTIGIKYCQLSYLKKSRKQSHLHDSII